MLQEIARVLKIDRLPSESLYYLGNATFMIISHELSDRVLEQLNDHTKRLLNKIEVNGAAAQYSINGGRRRSIGKTWRTL